MIQNGTQTDKITYHLEHLSGLRPEMVQYDTETHRLERLGGLGHEINQNELFGTTNWTGLGPKLKI